ncbi:MAG: molybdopterin-dependent oxidoreductase, partial [Nocardioides sp.]|nr:molybdopterin-dependent oxidoreductase [Nocardioides sp.]
AAAALAAATGARLAWVPRRAGDRGAVEAGALPNLLPGGRPVADAAARVDAAAAWGVDSLPATDGRDGEAIIAAAAKGDLGGLVIGGVDPDDTRDPAAFRAALEAASFVVSLEQRESDVTRVADVVFPVAPVTDKAGTFVTWEGRPRPFEAVFSNPASLPDLRVVAGISEELASLGQGASIGFRTVAEARAEMESLGAWDGARPAIEAGKAPRAAKPKANSLVLATWKQLIDLGLLQDGEEHLRATARRPVVRISQATYDSLFGMLEEDAFATVTGDRGSVDLPVEVADLPDGVVWVPANSFGRGVLADLASPGSSVVVKGARK